MGFAQKAGFWLDRTAVLFVGLALGSAITLSFYNDGRVPMPFTDGASGEGTTDATASGAGTTETPAGPLSTNTSTGAPAGATVQPATAAAPIVPTGGLASAIAEGRTIHVGVFGDSFGDGIWSALYRQLPRSQNYEVHQFSHQATGFTRYRQTNLLDDTRSKIDRQPIDIAVISFGANDTQGIFVDGQGSTYMSPRWQQIVGERAAAVVNLLRERGAMVFWVGLPRMRTAEFDGQIQQMNRFYAQQMAQLGVPYLETVSLTVDGSGAYSPYLVDPRSGERFNARAGDGIHMTINGYGILTRGLTDRIRAAVDQARGPQQTATAPEGRERPGNGSNDAPAPRNRSAGREERDESRGGRSSR